MVCEYRSQKKEKNRTRLTVGGNLILYPDEGYTATADIISAKLLFNDVISTPQALCTAVDLKNFYLNNALKKYEYIKLPIKIIPPEIITNYNL